MKQRFASYSRLLISCFFLGIFLARFAVSFIDVKAKTQYAVATEDNNNESKQGSEGKTDFKKIAFEYEHCAPGIIEHLMITKPTADLHAQAAAPTQPWHLSVPTPPPNLVG